MTTYKRPTFFDRDLKAFAELSSDAGADLGLVMRSLLVESLATVGTTGSAGSVSVKNADDAEAIKLDGALASIQYGVGNVVNTPNSMAGGTSTFAGVSMFPGSNDEQNQIFLSFMQGDVRNSFRSSGTLYFVYVDGNSGNPVWDGTRDFSAVTFDPFTNRTVITTSTPTQGYGQVYVADVTRLNESGNGASFGGGAAHAQGINTKAIGEGSHAEGSGNVAWGVASHAEGGSTNACATGSHAEGLETSAKGEYSHAEGYAASAVGASAHAEGFASIASGSYSHAEGVSTTASGESAHAEGGGSIASGACSHAEGLSCLAAGDYSHAEGQWTVANGLYSHASGYYTIATKDCQAVVGQLNVDANNTSLFVVGNGHYEGETAFRSDAFRVNTTSLESFVAMSFDTAEAKISGLVTANVTAEGDAATKGYVDAVAQGLVIKASCHVSSQANIADLATATEVDGHTLLEDERVLVRFQDSAIENGIYRFNGTGLVRAADMAVGSHAAGSFTFIQFGTNEDSGFVCTADAPTDVVGTDALPWVQFSSAGLIEAGDGLQKIGNTISVKLDGSTLSVSPDGAKVLGVPALFTIDGTAVESSVVASALNTLTLGAASNANALHSHSADAEYLPPAVGLAAGQAAIINASSEAEAAGTTSTGAYMVGVVESIAGGFARIVRGGLAAGVLTGATAGDVYYVQADGTLAVTLPASGRVVMAGVAKSATDLHVQVRDFGNILAA